jgi:hypothetical protein
MKKYIGFSVSLMMLVVPAGIALAKDGGSERGSPSPDTSVGISQHLEANFEITSGQGHGGENEADNATSSENTNEDQGDDSQRATSTPWMHGEKEGLLKHFGTTTPPGMLRQREGGEGASSSREDRGGNGSGNEHMGGIQRLFQWLFGLPGTTTVADIRANINASASTSASSNTDVPSTPAVFNFFRHFFEGIGSFFGGRGEN